MDTSHRQVPQRPEAGRIGVGFAGTPGGSGALAWAVEETLARGTTLTICHAGDGGRPHIIAAPDLIPRSR